MTLDLEREQAVQALSAHFAHDHLSTQELELRFEMVYRATTLEELRALTAGLPALPGSVAPTPMYAMASPTPTLAREKRFLALMSEVRRQGIWEVPPRVKAKAFMGAVRLDLREGVLPPGGVDIQATAFMGEVRIILPPGVRADVDGMAIIGEFTDRSVSTGSAADGAPVVRVSGEAFMGAVRVETRLSSETAIEAWKRRLLGS
jgi:hypothetical protein